MEKLKRFFHNVWRSAVDFSYYKDIVQAPFSFSLKYIFFLLVIINLAGGVFFGLNLIKIIPQLPKISEDIKTTARSLFPSDLIININNGTVKTNVDEPYFIDFPENLKSRDNRYLHLITIDTKANIDEINTYKTIMLVTKNNLVYIDRNSGYRVQPLSDIKGYYQIDKYVYNNILSKLLPYLRYLQAVIYIIIFTSIIIYPVAAASLDLSGKLIYLLFFCLILLVICRLLKISLNYKKIYQLSFHGLTIPIFISTLSAWFNFTLPPFSYSLIFLLIMTVILYQFKEKEKVLA